MRLFIVEHGLKSMVGHHYNNALAFRAEARRRGLETRIYVNKEAEERIVALLEARPAFPYTPYRSLYADPIAGPLEDFHRLGPAFARGCSALEEDGVTAEDVVLLPLAFCNEILGCSLWLKSIPEDRAPRLVLNFMTERETRGEAAVSEALTQAMYRFAANRLSEVISKDRVIFSATVAQFARVIGERTRFPVEVFPHAMGYDDPCDESLDLAAARPDGQVLVSLLGHSREEKGFELIPEIVRRCSEADPALSFFVQIAPGQMAKLWGGSFERLRAMANVRLHLGELSASAYLQRLRDADIVLLPYDATKFTLRPSGVFSEAVAHGKVTVIPAATWMAGHLENGRGSGAVFEGFSAERIAAAVQAAAGRLEELNAKACACAAHWRRDMSVAGFLDRMLDRLNAR